MISIIICSRHSALSDKLQNNIQATIGDCTYEIIHIDNSENTYNIFEAYNLGIRRAQGDMLCFMHEDILFHSMDWGHRVRRYLTDDECGILGVAGGYAVLQESDWRLYGKWVVNLIQGHRTIEKSPRYYVSYPKVKDEAPVEVAALDGVWFCIRKEMFGRISFDDTTFTGFHMYDTDICMQIHQLGKKAVVCQDILIEHFSEGSYTPSFQTALAAFHNKWKDSLPLIKTISLTQGEVERLCRSGKETLAEEIMKGTSKKALQELFSGQSDRTNVRPLTDIEKKLIGQSLYSYCKATVKDRRQGCIEAYRHISPYMWRPECPHKAKIVLKFIVYRLMMVFRRTEPV